MGRGYLMQITLGEVKLLLCVVYLFGTIYTTLYINSGFLLVHEIITTRDTLL